jgi:hypothetical protein
MGQGGDGMSEQGGVKIDTIRWVGGMLLAGAVSYFATTYGLQERIALLEQRVVYMQKENEQRLVYLQQTIDDMRADMKKQATADWRPTPTPATGRRIFDH